MSDLGTLGELAERTCGRVIGDASIRVTTVVAVDDAVPGALTFATDARYLRLALVSSAAAVLVDAVLVDPHTEYAKPILSAESSRLALAIVLAQLEAPRAIGPYQHPTAAVDASAEIGARVSIGPQVSIGALARVGDDCVLGAGAVIGDRARLGVGCLLEPRAYVAHDCVLGARVLLGAGAVIGSDGFGWAFHEGTLRKIPQVGIVELGDDVDIGANTCVDRAQTGVTSIGRGSKIDNLCQIGHNSRIGQHTALAAFAGLAGTTVIGDYTQVGGQVMFKGHITVGSRVVIAGGSHVWGDVEDGAFISGRPTQHHRDEVRLQAHIRRLPKLVSRVDSLERAARTPPGP